MSAGSVACMIIWPLRALSGTPLTSMLTVSSAMTLSRHRRLRGIGRARRGRPVHQRAALVLDHVFEFVAEVLQEALHRPSGGIAQRANGMALDSIRHIEQQSQVLAPAL